jgi:PAS domain S-box-containing protein
MRPTPEISALVFEALEQSAETFFITDSAGVIVYANPSFERLTGYTIEESLGRNANFLKSGEHSGDFYADLWNTLKAGGEWTGRFINKRKDGKTYTAETRISPMRDSKGETTHFLARRRDITRETALEQQLLQSQKMEALGLLAGQLSHDFNNLLTIIIGSMELIMEEIPKEGVSMKLAHGILQTSKESANLIKQLLIFARRQEYEPSIVNLNDVIGDIRILLDRLPGANIGLEYTLAPDLAKVNLEPEQFKQALINLVINAKDAMPSGGTIKIRTFNSVTAAEPLSTVKTGGCVAVEVSDTGAGIPAEAMEHLFEPFFTTKPKGKGTGLGLSTVYGIITQNKGEIRAESKPDQGAVFTIYLPKASS